jgi:deoxyribonuclease V
LFFRPCHSKIILPNGPQEVGKIQLDCSKRVVLKDGFEKLELVGGMDLTFEDVKGTPTRAWASLVVLELKSLRPIYQKVVEGVVDFPYIPTFLAFREMPLMLELYREAKVRADVYFIDGQGIAHPRGCGIASHFGVETNTPTVGVAKTILVERYRSLHQSVGAFRLFITGERW